MDRLKQQLGDAVIVLAGAQDGKAALVAGVNGSAMGKVKAGELLSHIAGQIGGRAADARTSPGWWRGRARPCHCAGCRRRMGQPRL